MKLQKITATELFKLKEGGWNLDGKAISKAFFFDSQNGKSPYLNGLEFVNRVAKLSEEMNHHPDISYSYKSVVVLLTTHDIGDLSNKDYEIAMAIDGIVIA